MINILVNVAALDAKIGKLNALKAECEAIDVTANDLVGSGLSIDVLKSIDEEYAAIQLAIVQLLDNSIQFFTDVKSTVVKTDGRVANRFEMVELN